MSQRKFSPDAFRLSLQADRFARFTPALTWRNIPDFDDGIAQHRCYHDGSFVGYCFLDKGKFQTAVFVPGIEPSVRSVGTFPMSPVGERAAKAAIEADVLAGNLVVEAA